MSERRYSEAEIRTLLEQLAHPMLAVRSGRICVVNAAYAQLQGVPGEQLEGRHYAELLSPEERQRMAELSALKQAGRGLETGHMFAMASDTQGRRQPLDVHTQILRSLEGEDYTVATVFRGEEQQRAVDFTELLVETSAAIVAERSTQGVEQAVLRCLGRGGLIATFYRPQGDTFEPAPGNEAALRFRVEYAREALTRSGPVFGGVPDWAPSQVYLPLRGETFDARVLLVSGASIDSRLSSVFSLFARLLSAALGNAAEHDDSSRRLSESRLLLDLAHTTASTLELATVLDVACDSLVKLLDVPQCFILLHDAKARVLRGSAASAEHREDVRSVTIPLDDEASVAARVARERRSVAVGRVGAGEPGRADLAERFHDTAIVGVPLIARDELIGVVILGETRGARQFSRSWVELAEATVSQLALSVSSARLYESLRQSFAELAQTRAEMVRRERLAALGELSAVVAHEVRNPLAVIFNAVSSLRRQLSMAVESPAQTSQLLDILSEESDRLNRIVNDLLDFARPRDLRLEPEDLEEVIRESIDAAALYPTTDGRVTFEAQVDPGLPAVRLDRLLMRQALVNVAVNAIQAMPKGGTLRVKACRELIDGRDQVRIDLSDDGPGIPADIAPRIFEPFFTTKAQGTGLGLAVVKRILEEHRGEVKVRSEGGQGTTFTFRLPLEADSGTT